MMHGETRHQRNAMLHNYACDGNTKARGRPRVFGVCWFKHAITTRLVGWTRGRSDDSVYTFATLLVYDTSPAPAPTPPDHNATTPPHHHAPHHHYHAATPPRHRTTTLPYNYTATPPLITPRHHHTDKTPPQHTMYASTYVCIHHYACGASRKMICHGARDWYVIGT